MDDHSKVGPGTYLIDDRMIKKSPSNTINWLHSQSKRSGIVASTRTQETVGPGSYNGEMRFYKPDQPFFGRNGLGGSKTTKAKKGAASIRRNFEDFEDSENEDELL